MKQLGNSKESPRTMAARWTEYRRLFAEFGLHEPTTLCDRVLTDLRDQEVGHLDELVTPERASELSGYSTSQLRRLAREGKVDAEKHGRDWWFRQGALPRKPKPRDQRSGPYVPETDAADIHHRFGKAVA